MTSQIQLNPLILNLQTKRHTRGARTVSRHCQNEDILSKQLGNVQHSAIVGMVLPLVSIWNHPVGVGVGELATPHPWPLHSPLGWPTPCGVCFSLNLNKCTSYLSLCLSLNFWNETCFIRSWSQAAWVLAGLKSQERRAEGWTGGKSSGKNVLRNPLHNLPENLLPDLCSQFSLGWSLA